MAPNVLIIGGSSGIGLAVAKLALTHLSTETPNIIISSSNQDKVSGAISELKSIPVSRSDVVVDGIAADLSRNATQFEEVKRVLEFAVGRCGKINSLVWCAGDLPSPEAMQDWAGNADLISIQTLRIFGPLTLLNLAKQYMDVARTSSITISSGALLKKPPMGRGRIAAAAGGLINIAAAMAVELSPIRCNSIVLGAIDTPLTRKNTGGEESAMQALADKTLVKAVGSAAEAAEAYLFSMRCAFATGSEIYCDGGGLLC